MGPFEIPLLCSRSLPLSNYQLFQKTQVRPLPRARPTWLFEILSVPERKEVKFSQPSGKDQKVLCLFTWRADSSWQGDELDELTSGTSSYRPGLFSVVFVKSVLRCVCLSPWHIPVCLHRGSPFLGRYPSPPKGPYSLVVNLSPSNEDAVSLWFCLLSLTSPGRTKSYARM